MKYKWEVSARGSITFFTLEVVVDGQRWLLSRAHDNYLMSQSYYRDNILTNMIDDLMRNIGRHYIQLPKEPKEPNQCLSA